MDEKQGLKCRMLNFADLYYLWEKPQMNRQTTHACLTEWNMSFCPEEVQNKRQSES